MRQEHATAFKTAFESAMLALRHRDRFILQLRYLDGLNIDAIGQILGVHRSSAARWLVAARGAL